MQHRPFGPFACTLPREKRVAHSKRTTDSVIAIVSTIESDSLTDLIPLLVALWDEPHHNR
jgi:hypothetical protein